jgi:4-alpha-glucanotransferase
VIQDLPIGVDPNGADAWSWQDLLADGVTVGAPPDEFNTSGQDWGLPPFVPGRVRRDGYRPFIETIRSSLTTGGLRIDHVMGLFRLWWIPSGAEPSDGAYVRYRADELLAIVALESHRAGALVVGEDLGTVEAGVREALCDHNVLSYRLLWFEDDLPSAWPRSAMAAITTHDLPTVAGLWDGSDLEEQRRCGLRPNEAGTAAIRQRLKAAGGLAEDASSTDAVIAAHRLLARAPSILLSATLEDAVVEPQRTNIPGADGKRPNWSLSLPVPLEEIRHRAVPVEIAHALGTAVASASEE